MIALSWSGGKDSARALEALRRQGTPPVALLTTVDEESGRVTHHHTPGELLRAQADAAGLPLVEIPIPDRASDVVYAERMRAAFADQRLAGVTTVAFGDLFLGELRRFREQRLAAAGLEAAFPLWGRDSAALAAEIARDYSATVVSVDPSTLDAELLGRRYDAAFLVDLPSDADPCGERGEFHTFVTDCPAFGAAVAVEPGSRGLRDGFPVLDLVATA